MDMTAFAAHPQRGGLPIDVIQLQKSNCTGPQPQAGEQQQYCIISAAYSSATSAVRQDPAYVLRLDRPADRGTRPMRHRRNPGGKVSRDVAAIARKTEKRAQSRRQLSC